MPIHTLVDMYVVSTYAPAVGYHISLFSIYYGSKECKPTYYAKVGRIVGESDTCGVIVEWDSGITKLHSYSEVEGYALFNTREKADTYAKAKLAEYAEDVRKDEAEKAARKAEREAQEAKKIAEAAAAKKKPVRRRTR